jgi:filamentous hemagglutinin
VYQVGELGLLVHNECVYQALDQAGNIIYVGITKNFATRQAQHASRFQIQPIIQGLTRSDARAIEQRLIETIGLGKNGGTLLNKINSIAFSNPVYATAIQRAIALGF